MGSSVDGEFTRSKVEMGSSGDGSLGDEEFTRRGFQEMESLRDVEFRSWDVHEMGSSRDGDCSR